MGVYLYRKRLGNSGLELKMGVLEFPLKLQVPNTNVLFRFYVFRLSSFASPEILGKKIESGSCNQSIFCGMLSGASYKKERKL